MASNLPLASLETGLLAWWDFNDLEDQHGSNDLTGVNSPVFSDGKIGNALYLDNTNSRYARILNANASALQMGTSDLTIAGWVYFDSAYVGSWSDVLTFGGTGSSTAGYHIGIRNNGDVFAWFSDGSTRISVSTSGTPFTLDTWHFIVIRFDRDGNLSVKMDVANEGTGSIAGGDGIDVQSANDFHFGSGWVATPDARLGSWGIWSRVITVDEETALYARGRAVEYTAEIQRDYKDNEDVYHFSVTLNSSQVAGSGTYAGKAIPVPQSLIPDALIDSDLSSYDATAATLRASTSAPSDSVLVQIPIATPNWSPASGGSSGGAKCEIFVPVETFDADNDQDIHFYWEPNSGKSKHADDHAYGSQMVNPESTKLSLKKTDYSDATENEQTVTAANMSTTSETPWGADAFDFNGSSSKLTVSHDLSLSFQDAVSITYLVRLNDLSSAGFQSIYARRRGFDTNYGSHINPNDGGVDKKNAYWYWSGFKAQTIDLSDNFTEDEWHVATDKIRQSGSDVIVTQYVDGVKISETTINTVNMSTIVADLLFGATETGTGIFGEFADMQLKWPRVMNDNMSDDLTETIHNSMLDPGSFLTASAATQPYAPVSSGAMMGKMSLSLGVSI